MFGRIMTIATLAAALLGGCTSMEGPLGASSSGFGETTILLEVPLPIVHASGTAIAGWSSTTIRETTDDAPVYSDVNRGSTGPLVPKAFDLGNWWVVVAPRGGAPRFLAKPDQGCRPILAEESSQRVGTLRQSKAKAEVTRGPSQIGTNEDESAPHGGQQARQEGIASLHPRIR